MIRPRFAAEAVAVESISAAKWRWIGFWAAHVPLGVLASQNPMIGTLHGMLAVIVGVWLAAYGKTLKYVAYAAAYIVAAEVLWRMTRATILPWETGKYATALIFVIALIRLRRVNMPKLPALYFALLLPSTLLLFTQLGFAEARKEISFNLSGPLTLMLCVAFFFHLRLNAEQLQRMFMVFAAPIISIAMFILFNLSTNSDIVFTGESNRAVTGGFGPNQVSAALGLGALLMLFCLLYEKKSKVLRFLIIGTIAFFMTQAAMTFSRGGLFNAIGAALLGSLFLMKDARSRINLIVIAGLMFVAVQFVLLPRLDAFTGGALEARLQNVDPTGRDHLFAADLKIWADNPIFGVGPGQATASRDELMLIAHTEFSRLLSEHGVFGFAALITLLAAGWVAIKRARGAQSKALVVALIAWCFLFMLNAAMRTAAPAFVFGLAYATFRLENRNVRFARTKRQRSAQPAFW